MQPLFKKFLETVNLRSVYSRVKVRLHTLILPFIGWLLLFFIKRQTLRFLKNTLISITKKLSTFIPNSIMSSKNQSNSPNLTNTHLKSPKKDPKFDPKKPSNPLSYPIKTLEELEKRVYFESFHYPFNKAKIPLNGDIFLGKKSRVLVCHDMEGGYLESDKWVQGGNNWDAYCIWHWYLIDVFVYFSHNLVTIPPPGWVNAAHKHGVKVLGTFLTEWDEGRIISDKLLSSAEYARMCADRLTELAVALGFDGWLINMEVKIDRSQIANLKEFVSHLTDMMHMSKPGSLVIWYDSVTVDGHLDWQDQLNDKNKAFFDLCDGIFTNYTWKEGYTKLSADVAGDRKFDVYMGIDVFGRNTFGGGKWNTNVALDVIRKDEVSAAIFAPGWVYEDKQPPDFQTAQNRWWGLIEQSWGVVQNYPRSIPFYSDFNQGRGHHVSIDGNQVSDADWCNLSCQSFQPFLEYSEDLGIDVIQASVNLEGDSYSGGGNVTFKGILGSVGYSSKRLFQANLFIEDPVLNIAYSVKSDADSLVGLSLELLSNDGERETVLLASHGNTLLTVNQFSSKFSKVILPHKVTKLESTDGWVLQENVIGMPGYTLTEIRAVCYQLRSEINEEKISEYYAILGGLSIQSSGQKVQFPPSSSWVVEHQDVTWKVGPSESKFVNLTILWRSKDGNNLNEFQKYNIYVEKTSEDADSNVKLQATKEFIGITLVEAFYVSDLLVPSDISSLKFIIQICGVDGTFQPLDVSPSFQLDVKAFVG